MSWGVPMEFSRVWVIGTAVESGVVVFEGVLNLKVVGGSCR
jgi:hypothetical protein